MRAGRHAGISSPAHADYFASPVAGPAWLARREAVPSSARTLNLTTHISSGLRTLVGFSKTMLATVHGVASTMRQREAGAVQPLARKALVITRYVSGGNVSNVVQFQTAPYFRFVRVATSAIPPS